MVRIGRFIGIDEPGQDYKPGPTTITDSRVGYGLCHACGSKVKGRAKKVCLACKERGHGDCLKSECERCKNGSTI